MIRAWIYSIRVYHYGNQDSYREYEVAVIVFSIFPHERSHVITQKLVTSSIDNDCTNCMFSSNSMTLNFLNIYSSEHDWSFQKLYNDSSYEEVVVCGLCNSREYHGMVCSVFIAHACLSELHIICRLRLHCSYVIDISWLCCCTTYLL